MNGERLAEKVVKPRLWRAGGNWWCSLNAYTGPNFWGKSPREAYAQWWMFMFKRELL